MGTEPRGSLRGARSGLTGCGAAREPWRDTEVMDAPGRQELDARLRFGLFGALVAVALILH